MYRLAVKFARSSSVGNFQGFRKYTSSQNDMAGELVVYGLRCLQEGKYEDALRTLEHGSTLLQDDHLSAPVKMLMAKVHEERGRHDFAVDVLSDLIKSTSSNSVKVAAHGTLSTLCLKEHSDERAIEQAQGAVRAAVEEENSGSELAQALTVQAHGIASLVHLVNCDASSPLTAAVISETAMTKWDEEGNPPSPQRDARVAGAIECAAASLHASQPMDNEENAKAVCWVYSRSASASTAALSALAEDPLTGLAAMHVHPSALLGEAQVLLAAGQLKESEEKATEVIKILEQPTDSQNAGQAPPAAGAGALRLGLALGVLGEVYHRRALRTRSTLEKESGMPVFSEGGGGFMLAEGLFKRSLELLGAPPNLPPQQEMDADPTSCLVFPADPRVVAVMRGRYAHILRQTPGRSKEADRWRELAERTWNLVENDVELAVVIGEDTGLYNGNPIFHLRTGRLIIPVLNAESRDSMG